MNYVLTTRCEIRDSPWILRCKRRTFFTMFSWKQIDPFNSKFISVLAYTALYFLAKTPFKRIFSDGELLDKQGKVFSQVNKYKLQIFGVLVPLNIHFLLQLTTTIFLGTIVLNQHVSKIYLPRTSPYNSLTIDISNCEFCYI